MKRDVETLVRRIREELRAEGADGAGYSDFIIEDAINKAMYDLVEFFPIKDVLNFSTTADTHQYSLTTRFPTTQIENIVRVTYDGLLIKGMGLDAFFAVTLPEEGTVDNWTLWGDKFILVGEIEADKTVELYVTRAPKQLSEKGDTPETPYYADEAIIHYAITACYRESRDYDRASVHFNIYQHQRNNVLKRGIPQGQRDHKVVMQDNYWGPVTERDGVPRSDTNPGGRE